MDTWRQLISEEMDENGDSWDNVVGKALGRNPEAEWKEPSEVSLDASFDDGYGCTQGCRFTLWTHHYVYFPVCYDGAEWVGSVSRDPNGVAKAHVGGG